MAAGLQYPIVSLTQRGMLHVVAIGRPAKSLNSEELTPRPPTFLMEGDHSVSEIPMDADGSVLADRSAAPLMSVSGADLGRLARPALPVSRAPVGLRL